MNTEVIDNCQLDGLTENCKPGLGSIKRLQIIKVDDTLSTPFCCSDGKQVTGEMTVKAGTGFKDYYFEPDKAIFTEDQENGDGGTLYRQQIRVNRYGNDPNVIEELSKLGPSRTIAAITLWSGYRRLIGSKSNPLLFLGKSTTTETRKRAPNADLVFYKDAKCLACFLPDEFLVPDSTQGIPTAFLRVFRLNTCSPVSLSALGSMRQNGTFLTTTTPGSQVKIIYTFGSFQNPYFEAEIGPDGDPGDMASWTFLRGSLTSTDFENMIVNKVIAGGSALGFTFNALLLSNSISTQKLDVHLQVKELAVYSQVVSGEFQLNDVQAFNASLNGNQIIMGVTPLSDCNILVNFGDNTSETREMTAGVPEYFNHNYASSGNYNVEIVATPENISQVNFISTAPYITSFEGPRLANLELLSLQNLTTFGDSFSIRPHPIMRTFIIAGSGISYLDPGTSKNLVVLDASTNNLSGTFDLTPFDNLNSVQLFSNSLETVTLGGSKPDLSLLNLNNNSMQAAELDALIDELWQMRKEHTGATLPNIILTNNPGSGSISADSQAKIDGTGAYAGEGLDTDYGWTISL